MMDKKFEKDIILSLAQYFKMDYETFIYIVIKSLFGDINNDAFHLNAFYDGE